MPSRYTDDGARVVVAPVPLAAGPRAIAEQQMPGTYNLEIYRGDTYEWIFRFLATDGYPIDVTGWQVRGEIRGGVDGDLLASMQPSRAPCPPLTTVEECGRIQLEDRREGRVRMRLTSDQSRMITSSGAWDLEAVTPDGWTRTVLRGTVSLLGDITTGDITYGIL